MIKVQAIKELISEHKNMNVTHAGYKRCKQAVAVLGLDPDEQFLVLVHLEFRKFLINDPKFSKQYAQFSDKPEQP